LSKDLKIENPNFLGKSKAKEKKLADGHSHFGEWQPRVTPTLAMPLVYHILLLLLAQYGLHGCLIQSF